MEGHNLNNFLLDQFILLSEAKKCFFNRPSPSSLSALLFLHIVYYLLLFMKSLPPEVKVIAFW
jgi:hypothetical protein